MHHRTFVQTVGTLSGRHQQAILPLICVHLRPSAVKNLCRRIDLPGGIGPLSILWSACPDPVLTASSPLAPRRRTRCGGNPRSGARRVAAALRDGIPGAFDQGCVCVWLFSVERGRRSERLHDAPSRSLPGPVAITGQVSARVFSSRGYFRAPDAVRLSSTLVFASIWLPSRVTSPAGSSIRMPTV